MRTSAWAATAAATLLLAACGGGDDDDNDDGNGTPAVVARTCDTASMSALSIPGAAVTAASAVAAGSYTPPGGQALTNLPAFCRVDAQATPTSDSLINFQVWVPQGTAWNGKLVVTGNGGYSPALSYSDMAYAMRQGYAVVGGDTGHQSADPNDMFWGVGHPEKILDWGSRSIHAITVPAKQAVTALHAQAPRRAYYYGCSTGGHQGYARDAALPGRLRRRHRRRAGQQPDAAQRRVPAPLPVEPRAEHELAADPVGGEGVAHHDRRGRRLRRASTASPTA